MDRKQDKQKKIRNNKVRKSFRKKRDAILQYSQLRNRVIKIKEG